MHEQLHKAQISILYTLRRSHVARFSDLMHPTGLESDNFKFHLKKLQKLGFLEKTESGEYVLTANGKEFANNLDWHAQTVQKQPKLSIMIVAKRTGSDGIERYLVQERLRTPYWGFWGFLCGPIRWGNTPETTAAYELSKQASLNADFTVKGFYRKRDYGIESEALLEDKLFTIVEAHNIKDGRQNTWQGGRNAWLTLDELRAMPKRFDASFAIVDMLERGEMYMSDQSKYHDTEY